MKKTLLLFLGLGVMAFTVFLSSCKEDEPVLDPASLVLTPDSASFTGVPGDVKSIQVVATAPAGFVSLKIDKTVGTGTPTVIETVNDTNGDNTETFTFTYTLLAEEVGETVVLTFDLEETGTAGATEQVTIITNSPPANRFTEVLLYAPLGDKSAESFFSTNTGLTYSPAEVNASSEVISDDIDFGYYYGVTDEASLASPAGYESTVFAAQVSTWSVKNDILFKSTTLDASAFSELSTEADIDEVFAAGADEGNIISGLIAGDVIAFQTDAGKDVGSKKGVLLVLEQMGTFNEGDYIKIEVIVQE
ncbi:MAG TPA: hypothetical protein VI583_05025 [Cyclobacteriaceae bacterium]|nr:hypothetical protein [Cyclobacteriaceae bacterium]